MALRAIGVRQLRDELASVMEELSEVGVIIITQRGEGKAVLVELDRYNQLLDRLEFLEDSLDALEGQREGAVPVRELS
ncbi:MAG: type II toxin-antitoxin system Phd/YefM family antitoxin [Actinobacteria bacterium]|nr:type II toxin-antitoxin system Phd/YefM family antitoxin [Actinomycetota bacterium]